MSKLTDEFLKWLPKHQGGLFLCHNPHIEMDLDVSTWLDEQSEEIIYDFATPDEQQETQGGNEIWTMIWYPVAESTIASYRFHAIAAPTLEKLLLFAHDPRFRSDGNE